MLAGTAEGDGTGIPTAASQADRLRTAPNGAKLLPQIGIAIEAHPCLVVAVTDQTSAFDPERIIFYVIMRQPQRCAPQGDSEKL